jgi:3-dehydroquinate synthase
MSENASLITIKSGQGDYPVLFEKTIGAILPKLRFANDEVFILADSNVWQIYSKQFSSLSKFPVLVIDAIEPSKTLDGVSTVVDWLIQNGATRSSTILAIGGGIVQDVATFTAHIYYRGIKWQFMPTTLLSQSDSCIGAKCGINVLPHKNQLGVIHSPSAVYIVEEFLATLSDADFRSGFGEIYKLSVTGENEFYSSLKVHLEKFGLSRSEVLPIIQASLLSKKVVIEEDEYETDLRRILNYGHSFGHALEALTHNAVSHGIGVLFGMDLINFLGVRWGITSEDYYREFNSLIGRYFSVERLPQGVTAEALVKEVKKDKKIASGVMNFAIVNSPGDIRIYKRELNNALIDEVQEYLDEYPVFRTA